MGSEQIYFRVHSFSAKLVAQRATLAIQANATHGEKSAALFDLECRNVLHAGEISYLLRLALPFL